MMTSTTSYRLTFYENGQITRMLPFEALSVGEAIIFGDSQRFGQTAVLSDGGGIVKRYVDDAFQGVAERLRRRTPLR